MYTVTSAAHKLTEKDLVNTNSSDLLFLRIDDSAMVVVGCIEGCAVQTVIFLRHVLVERVIPSLFSAEGSQKVVMSFSL